MSTAAMARFVLPPELAAHEPAEARGLSRDGVRMLVGSASSGSVRHRRFTDLPDLLRAGDVLVVNRSATLPAAVPVASHALRGDRLAVHFSTELPGGDWLVELRLLGAGKASVPFAGGEGGRRYPLPGGGSVLLCGAYSAGRLWQARVDTGRLGSVLAFLSRYGQPIRYSYVPRAWPLADYQTVFGTEPGSAEMPSAGRPFTDRVVTRLVAAGVLLAPIVLHTGVASPEAHERPYAERFAVPAGTAAALNAARDGGSRVIAVGTTVVRAVESAVGRDGRAAAARGWTDLIVTPERGVQAVDGLLTGFHEPNASHLDMLAAIAGYPLLNRCYAEALAGGYQWHEFGDVNLLLP